MSAMRIPSRPAPTVPPNGSAYASARPTKSVASGAQRSSKAQQASSSSNWSLFGVRLSNMSKQNQATTKKVPPPRPPPPKFNSNPTPAVQSGWATFSSSSDYSSTNAPQRSAADLLLIDWDSVPDAPSAAVTGTYTTFPSSQAIAPTYSSGASLLDTSISPSSSSSFAKRTTSYGTIDDRTPSSGVGSMSSLFNSGSSTSLSSNYTKSSDSPSAAVFHVGAPWSGTASNNALKIAPTIIRAQPSTKKPLALSQSQSQFNPYYQQQPAVTSQQLIGSLTTPSTPVPSSRTSDYYSSCSGNSRDTSPVLFGEDSFNTSAGSDPPTPPMPCGPAPVLPTAGACDSDVDVAAAVPFGVALYAYHTGHPDDLEFEENDIIYLTQRLNDEWYSGRIDDRCGMFPANFVDIRVPLPIISNEAPTITSTPHTSPSSTDVNVATVLHTYEPQEDGLLDIVAGDRIRITCRVDDNWLMGSNEATGATGQVPVNFLDHVPVGV